MSEQVSFGARLRELREAAGLTQGELAEKIGVQWQAVSRWERGDREPSWGSIVALADALGVSCEAFRQEPSTEATEPRKPGRPRKTPEAGETPLGSEEPAPEPTPEPTPAAKKPRKRKSP